MIVKIILPGLAMIAWLGVARAACVLREADTVIHKDFFPGADSVARVTVSVTPELAARLKTRIGYIPVRSSYDVWVGRSGGHDVGYALIDDEKGMHEPITFAVLVSPEGSIVAQEILVYREPEGGGVASTGFTRQFIGKTVKDPIRAGKDITIVSSATISSQSIAVGVKRALAIVTEGILTQPPSTATTASVERTGG